VVLVLQAMIDFGVLPEDVSLISRLLHPLYGAVTCSRHRPWKGAWTRTRGNQDGIIAAPCGVNRAAVIQCADIDVNSGSVGLVFDHSAAPRSVQSHPPMWSPDHFWLRPT